MKECVKTIDNMNISDKQKRNIHSGIDKAKRNFLNEIADIIQESIDSKDIKTEIEHTHKGLNLRVNTKELQEVKEIKAICEYAGLNKVEDSLINKYFWFRFTIE